MWLEVVPLFHLTGLSLGTRARRIGRGNKTTASPSGPNLECGAGHSWLCPLPGQSQSLRPSAGTLARSGCGLARSGPSLAQVLE